MGSRRLNTRVLIAGLALLVAAIATLALGSTPKASSATAAPTDTAFTGSATGAQENPANASPGTASVTVVLNTAMTMITVDVTFQNLLSPATLAHLHLGAPGVNGPIHFNLTPGLPNSTSGTIPTATFPISSGQVTDLNNGNYYLNIHSDMFPNGEIRGQLAQGPTAVQLRSAIASRTSRGVLVRWRTATETQTLGFNVYRLQRGRLYRQQLGKLVKLNRTLIRSLGGAARGHAYSLLDRNAPSGRVTYQLQAVGRDGTRSWLSSTVARAG
jgi:CHRD domain